MQVTITPINIEGYQGSVTLEDVQPTTSIEEVYSLLKAYLIDNQQILSQYVWPQFAQVVYYLQSQPTSKLSPELILTDLQKKSKDISLAFIFPRDDLPIIQISLNNIAYYYVGDYTQFEELQNIIKSHNPIKAIIENSQYQEININKKTINLSKQKGNRIQTYIEGYKNSIVKILIKTKQPQDIQNREEEVKPPKEEKKNNNPPPQQQKKEQVGYQIPPKPAQQIKKVGQNQSKNQVPDKQSINLIIKFQSFSGGTTGRQEISILISNSSTMLSLLPSIITQLKSRGFDWDEEGYDHKRDSDKLNIIHESSQFKKLDRPFKSLIQEKQIVFTFERHYEGGAP